MRAVFTVGSFVIVVMVVMIVAASVGACTPNAPACATDVDCPPGASCDAAAGACIAGEGEGDAGEGEGEAGEGEGDAGEGEGDAGEGEGEGEADFTITFTPPALEGPAGIPLRVSFVAVGASGEVRAQEAPGVVAVGPGALWVTPALGVADVTIPFADDTGSVDAALTVVGDPAPTCAIYKNGDASAGNGVYPIMREGVVDPRDELCWMDPDPRVIDAPGATVAGATVVFVDDGATALGSFDDWLTPTLAPDPSGFALTDAFYQPYADHPVDDVIFGLGALADTEATMPAHRLPQSASSLLAIIANEGAVPNSQVNAGPIASPILTVDCAGQSAVSGMRVGRACDNPAGGTIYAGAGLDGFGVSAGVIELDPLPGYAIVAVRDDDFTMYPSAPSCQAHLDRGRSLDGRYLVDAFDVPVFCDLTTVAGKAYLLVGRSDDQGAVLGGFGWSDSTGALTDFTQPYSLGVLAHPNVHFDEVMIVRRGAHQVPDEAGYVVTIEDVILRAFTAQTIPVATCARAASWLDACEGTTQPDLLANIGLVSALDRFAFGLPDGSTGLFASGFVTPADGDGEACGDHGGLRSTVQGAVFVHQLP